MYRLGLIMAVNTGLLGQWGPLQPGGNMGADTPGLTQPALFNFFSVVGRSGVSISSPKFQDEFSLGAPPGRSSNHGK